MVIIKDVSMFLFGEDFDGQMLQRVYTLESTEPGRLYFSTKEARDWQKEKFSEMQCEFATFTVVSSATLRDGEVVILGSK